jgi:hypothetical protein
VILFWASKANDTAVVSYWVSWCDGRDDDWTAKSAIVENAHCGGPITKSTSLLVLAPDEVISLMGGFDDRDEMELMESYLDLPNTMYSDYLQGWTLDALEDFDGKEYVPKVVASIDHYGSKMSVYGRDTVAPSLNVASGTEGSIHFLIPTADMGLKQSVRPVPDHKLFALYGFSAEFAKTTVDLPQREKDLLLLWSMPKHSIKRVISVVQLAAESQAADNRMLALAREAGETPAMDSSVVPSFYCAPRQAEEAPFCFATSQVINRWTTIPCPTLEE